MRNLKKGLGPLPRTLMASAIIGIMLLSLFALPNTSAAAQAPEWEEGDAWAMGGEVDLGSMFDDLESDIEDLVDQMDEVTLERLSVDGDVGAWLLFEVTDVTSTEYVLEATAAAQFNIDAGVEISAEMDEAGTYSWDDDIPTDETTISIDLEAEFAGVVNVVITLEKDTAYVKDIQVNVDISAYVSFQAENIPQEDWDWESDEIVIYYDDYDVEIDFLLDLELNAEFDPYLNIYEFPMNVGDEWTVDSEVTITGSVDGYLDISGLPAEVEADMFTSEEMIEFGFTSFPIEFDQIDVDEDDVVVENGMLEPITETIEADMRCTSMSFKTVDDEQVAVYEIDVNYGESTLYYSDDLNFLTAMSDDIELPFDELGIDMDDEMMGDLMADLEGEMGVVDADEARSSIANIAEADVSGGGDSVGEVMDFFTSPPYFGLLLVALVALTIVAATVTVIRKH
jgi:hypothetical protein